MATLASGKRLPIAFFGHGSPTNVLEDNVATRTWQDMAARIGTPRAILCISAHWYTNGIAVTAMPAPKTIHDFGRSLPAPLFDQYYPAPGCPALAERVQSLLGKHRVALDQDWGLDHGAWSVLAKAFPKADIPVVQLSLDMTMSGAEHLALAERLRPLRNEGVLIAASGNIVHNLRVMEWGDDLDPYPWASSFNAFVKDRIEARDFVALTNVCSRREDAKMAVPHPDHYLPLLYALGASDEDDDIDFLSDFIVYRSLGMTSLMIGT